MEYRYGRAGQATDDNMAHAHCIWIRKAKNTPLENVIFVAFPLQKWSHERASVLRCRAPSEPGGTRCRREGK